MRLLSISILFVGLLTTFLYPQGNRDKTVADRTTLLDYGDSMYGEAYVIPSTRKDSATVVVTFRMVNEFMTFMRNTNKNTDSREYRAQMNVTIEVKDAIGIVRRRLPWHGVRYTESYDETNSRLQFQYGAVTFTVPPGTYTVEIEATARNQQRGTRIKIPPVHFDPDSRDLIVTTPIFAEPIDPGGDLEYRPFVFSGNIPFSSRDAAALIVVSHHQDVNYRYTIHQNPYKDDDIRWWMVSDIEGTVAARPSRYPSLSKGEKNEIPTFLTHEQAAQIESSGSDNYALLIVPIPITGMVPGRYQLNLFTPTLADSVVIHFQVTWESMPFTLRKLDYAIKLLSFITTEDQQDSVASGKPYERRERLMQFWRRYDATPATTFNEHLHEYYKRADNAFVTFRSIQEPDGAFSDRGKVYILHGPPTSIDKFVASNQAVNEVWIYRNNVARQFVFEVTDRGVFKLRRELRLD